MINSVSEPKEQEIVDRAVKNFWPWGNPLFQFELVFDPASKRIIIRLKIGNMILTPVILALLYLVRGSPLVDPILRGLK
jgi:hypothetical protein